MAAHEKFDFKTLEAVKAKAQELGAGLSFRDDLSPLFQPRKVGGRTAPNSMAVLPMEGCDSNTDGSPSELVERRYLRLRRVCKRPTLRRRRRMVRSTSR